MGGGRLELKEDDVEDRHLVGGRIEGVVVTSTSRTRGLCLLSSSIYASLWVRIADFDWSFL